MRALAVLCVALGLLACRPEPRGTSVVFVLVDTLRADHLGAYGYERDTSPYLDAFARESVVFEGASPPATCTFPSMNAMLTSRPPEQFLDQPVGLGIPEGTPTLAEMLRGAGYATHAISASPVVRATPSQVNQTGGFGAGFDTFDEACLWRSADCVNERALSLLEDVRTPFFLYLHYMDPHGPYGPPRGAPRRFARDYGGDKAFIRRGDPRPIERMLYSGGPDLGLAPEDVAHLVDLYDDDVAFFDRQLGALLGALEERGLLDASIVVIASDHGEEFLEHGHIKHCRSVYQASSWTPLLIRMPGGAPRGRSSAVVENLDLVPTLLDLLDVDASAWDLAGTSLRPLIEGTTPAPRRARTAQGSLRAVREGRFKLVADLEAGTAALYDLDADPNERADVAARHPDVRDRLMAEATAEEGAGAVGRDTEERLRALGYLE